jgi:hypothetical protein
MIARLSHPMVPQLSSDPKSGELGGMVRVPVGRYVDLLRATRQFGASKITVPTLAIRGAFDTRSTQADSQLLEKELGSEVKQYVEIPNASHMIQYLKVSEKELFDRFRILNSHRLAVLSKRKEKTAVDTFAQRRRISVNIGSNRTCSQISHLPRRTL